MALAMEESLCGSTFLEDTFHRHEIQLNPWFDDQALFGIRTQTQWHDK